MIQKRFPSITSLILLTTLILVSCDSREQEKFIIIRGGTLIDGTGSEPIENSVIRIEGNRITEVGSGNEVSIPANSELVDASGKYIIPGLIDAHIHLFQSAGLYGRPDMIDLRDEMPYDQEVEQNRNRIEEIFQSYLCRGVTSVVDVGGYIWSYYLREESETDTLAPRIAATGPLLSTIDYPILNVNDEPFWEMKHEDQTRILVDRLAAYQPDLLKIWYVFGIGGGPPVDREKASALARAAIEQASQHNLRVAAHATGLREAKDIVRAGAKILVHSVVEPIDEDFITLLKINDVIYIPNIVVLESYSDFFNQKLNLSRYSEECLIMDTVHSFVNLSDIPSEKFNPGPKSFFTHFPRFVNTLNENVRKVKNAGITIAVGTDAGNTMAFHGVSMAREMELLNAAGISPMEVIVAATRNSAMVMGRENELGTIEAGKLADIVILDENPLIDITNVTKISKVTKNGKVYDKDSLVLKGH